MHVHTIRHSPHYTIRAQHIISGIATMSIPPSNVHNGGGYLSFCQARRARNEHIPQGHNAARRLQFDELPPRAQQQNIQNAGQQVQRGNNERMPLQFDELPPRAQQQNIQNAGQQVQRVNNERMPLQFDELPPRAQQQNIQNAGQQVQRVNNERMPLQFDELPPRAQQQNIQDVWPLARQPAIILAPQAEVPNGHDDVDNPLAGLEVDDVLNIRHFQ
jgi:hypothetical protein